MSEQLRAQFDTIEIAAPGNSFTSAVDLEVTLECCTREQALAQIAAYGNRNHATVFVAPGTIGETSALETAAHTAPDVSAVNAIPNVLVNHSVVNPVSPETIAAQKINVPFAATPQNGASHATPAAAEVSPQIPTSTHAPNAAQQETSFPAAPPAQTSEPSDRFAQPGETWLSSLRGALQEWSGRHAMLRDVRAAERQRQAEAATADELQREITRARMAQESERIRQASLEVDRQLRAEEARQLSVLRSVEERQKLREEIDRKRREEFERERLAGIAEKHRLQVEARLELERKDALLRAAHEARLAQNQAEIVARQAAQQEARQKEREQREEAQMRHATQVSGAAGASTNRSLSEDEAAKLRVLAEIGAAVPGSQPAERIAANAGSSLVGSSHRSATLGNPAPRSSTPMTPVPVRRRFIGQRGWKAAAASAALVTVFAMLGWAAYANRRPASPLSGSANRQSQVRQSQVRQSDGSRSSFDEASTPQTTPKIIPVSVTPERTLQSSSVSKSSSTNKSSSTSKPRRVRRPSDDNDVAEDVVIRHFTTAPPPSEPIASDAPARVTTERVTKPSSPTFARAANKPVKQISDLD